MTFGGSLKGGSASVSGDRMPYPLTTRSKAIKQRPVKQQNAVRDHDPKGLPHL